MKPAAIRALIEQALEEYVDFRAIEEDAPGLWRVDGPVRSDEPQDELLPFLEEVAADATGVDVLLAGPVLSPSLPEWVRLQLLKAVEQKDDLVQARVVGPQRVAVRVRHQPLLLGAKRNRLPKLQTALAERGWSLVAEPLGTCVDVAALTTLPEQQAFLAPHLRTHDLDSEAVHDVRVIARRQELAVLIDAEGASPARLARAARTVRDGTDVLVRLAHRTSRARARDTVHARLEALPGIERFAVRWLDRKPAGVVATVDAEQGRSEELDAFFARLQDELGVPVSWSFDTNRSLLVDRIAARFPEDGILTGIRHVDETVYEVQALLPLRDHAELEVWSDRMEEEWGIELILSPAFLYAPDVRFRHELGADRETIARRYNRPRAFPPEVQRMAEEAAAAWDLEAEAARRLDIRDTVVVSIDPVRTKDLDDALSIEPAGPGVWRVGVHIADVGPFVPQGAPIDDEALRRSFTTYLAEGEIPVLPPVLSDEVCSLHGGQDSPALSLFVRLTDAGEALDWELHHTLIHNHCRLSYAHAQAILDGAEHEHMDRLRTMGRLAQTLRRRRKKEGALDLNLEEDPEKPSHQLIEEFMLLANECVARFLKAEHPLGLCLYRTHGEVPDTQFKALRGVGEFLRCSVEVVDQLSMQAALEELVAREDDRAYKVFRFHVGRVLDKATYHFEQLGHGALAKLHYAHFTSPIRRYSDLIVHRLIDDALAWRADPRGDPEAASSYRPEDLHPVCDQLNAMEIRVDSASFESHRLGELQRYDRMGRTERGVIVGLMRGRAAIRLDSTDLLVNVRYRTARFVEQEMPVRVDDENSGMSLALGMEVLVKSRGVDWARKSIDAMIVGVPEP